ncbi:hypothetical protein DSECCO2_518070 [anaerobic digester metagenome]
MGPVNDSSNHKIYINENPDFFSSNDACRSIILCTVRFKAQRENFRYNDPTRNAEFQ